MFPNFRIIGLEIISTIFSFLNPLMMMMKKELLFIFFLSIFLVMPSLIFRGCTKIHTHNIFIFLESCTHENSLK